MDEDFALFTRRDEEAAWTREDLAVLGDLPPVAFANRSGEVEKPTFEIERNRRARDSPGDAKPVPPPQPGSGEPAAAADEGAAPLAGKLAAKLAAKQQSS